METKNYLFCNIKCNIFEFLLESSNGSGNVFLCRLLCVLHYVAFQVIKIMIPSFVFILYIHPVHNVMWWIMCSWCVCYVCCFLVCANTEVSPANFIQTRTGGSRWVLKIKTSRPGFKVRGKKNNTGDELKRLQVEHTELIEQYCSIVLLRFHVDEFFFEL